MKDLLLYVADADAQAFIKSILNRPQALTIRDISFDIERHPQKDSGMVQSGAELARMKKGNYQKVLLTWDHHGSGRDHRQSPEAVRDEIQAKLDSFTWSGSNAVSIFVPELEQWIWFCETALLAYYGLTAEQLNTWIKEYSDKTGKSTEDAKTTQPKELFEFIIRERLKRTISPRDFEEIGRRAGIAGLMGCDTFRSVAQTLRRWFPQ